MGRRKLTDGERRTNELRVVTNDAEKAAIEQAVKDADARSVSEYLREAGLEKGKRLRRRKEKEAENGEV